MKRNIRGALSNPYLRNIASFFGRIYINMVFYSNRWQYLDARNDTLQEFVGEKPIILCVWHGRQLMMPKFWPSTRPLWVVGSTSRDGRLALATAERFKINVIQRSRMAGASNVARRILRVLASGHCVGLTPDGSRGPRMRVKTGVVELAKLSGCPLVPAAYSCSNAIILSSWDRFMLPLPLGRGVFIVGTPIEVDRMASPAQIEEVRCALEHQMNTLTDTADRTVGRSVIMPAERP
ncbi:lysophospholipid acyltransferase family protein [Zhengella sp. ZM62]|uniref:lysophospholipid acyltransferase family protein n=1 Tax=Zhengella sedimenti TaxID=3390035 RepID=UPI003976F53B